MQPTNQMSIWGLGMSLVTRMPWEETLRGILSLSWGLENDISSGWCAAQSKENSHKRKTQFWGDNEFIISDSYICTAYIACHGYEMSSLFKQDYLIHEHTRGYTLLCVHVLGNLAWHYSILLAEKKTVKRLQWNQFVTFEMNWQQHTAMKSNWYLTHKGVV